MLYDTSNLTNDEDMIELQKELIEPYIWKNLNATMKGQNINSRDSESTTLQCEGWGTTAYNACHVLRKFQGKQRI